MAFSFTKQTIEILKNLSGINNSILLEKNKDYIISISPAKNFMAKVMLPENQNKFEENIPVFSSLDKLIYLLSILEKNEVVITGSKMEIFGNNCFSSVFYLSSPELVAHSSKAENISLPSEDVSFVVSTNELNNVLKAMSIIGASDFSFYVSPEGVSVTGETISGYSENTKSNSFSFKLDEKNIVIPSKETFRATINHENLKFMEQGDYTVSISSKGIMRFKGHKLNKNVADYWASFSFNK